jgi:ABC-type polysaccharide/polyol phosphate export permease
VSEGVYISTGGRSDILVGLTDLFRGLAQRRLWLAFAADEVQTRYRRSKLGLAWIVLSYLLFVGSISIFFGGFSTKDAREFTAYVAVNYAMFSFLVANLTDGCACLRASKSWVNSIPLPHSIYVLKSVARGMFVFGISMSLAIIFLLITGHLRTTVSLLAVPALLVVLVNAVLLQTILGYISARYRDVEHLMQSLTRILFFVTPILWVRAEQVDGSLQRTIADMNPITHALEIFSAPMLGHMPDLYSWKVMGIITLVNFIIMLGVSYLSHRRLPYWL